MSGEQTLRAIHERCKARHGENVIHAYSGAVAGTGRCRYCQRVHPCPDYSDAVAALNLLAAGELVGLDETEMVAFRLVADPLPSGGEVT